MTLFERIFIVLVGFAVAIPVSADVVVKELSEENVFVRVTNADWQPEGFENGILIPAAHIPEPAVVIDGSAEEAIWDIAEEVRVPLQFGSVVEASVKALYTDKEIFLRVRWPDATQDREHHPWVWNGEENAWVSGPQIEDSILLSFEAGCEWAPSLLQGYVYDFDGWRWLAARSDPVGQAWDLDGTVQDQMIPDLNFTRYDSRYSGMHWNVKFVDRNDQTIIHDDWDQLNRMYFYRRAGESVYIRAEPDRMDVTDPSLLLPPPSAPPLAGNETHPQFQPVRLEGDAGEVTAKGQWQDGYWTVEFRRSLITPGDTMTDWVFVRLSQFSLYIFDGVERLDQASESPRLFLRLMPTDQLLVEKK